MDEGDYWLQVSISRQGFNQRTEPLKVLGAKEGVLELLKADLNSFQDCYDLRKLLNCIHLGQTCDQNSLFNGRQKLSQLFRNLDLDEILKVNPISSF